MDATQALPGVFETTFGERGNLLPSGDQPSRSFAFMPWRTRDEKIVCGVRDKDRAITPAGFAGVVMAHFLTDFAGHNFAGLTMPERRLQIARSYAGDIFSVWFQLRREAMGEDLDIQLACGSCRYEFTLGVDLSTVTVKCAEDGADLRRKVPLRDGFDWKGETATAVTLEPLRWGFYESINASLNTGEIKARAAARAIVEVNGKPLAAPLPESALDDLSKRDFEAITATLDSENLGPDLAVQEYCPKCGSKVLRQIPWMYDSFFSARPSGRGAA